jgi:hypothetical protein
LRRKGVKGLGQKPLVVAGDEQEAARLGVALPVRATTRQMMAMVCVRVEGVRCARDGVEGRMRERERVLRGQMDKWRKKMGSLELIVVGRISGEIQRATLPHPRGGTATLPKQQRVSYILCDSLDLRYGHISSIYHDQKQINIINHGHAI